MSDGKNLFSGNDRMVICEWQNGVQRVADSG